MNLLQSETLNARAALVRHNVKPSCVYFGWNEGKISMIIHCPPEKAKEVLNTLRDQTDITLPVIIREEELTFF